MPEYRNDTGNKINMLSKIVKPGETVSTKYYPNANSEVVLGSNNPPGTIIKTFAEATNDGDVVKTSDYPTWLLIDLTISSETFSPWVYIRGRRDVDITIDVSSDFDGVISLQRKYRADDDPVTVSTFDTNSDVGSYFHVPTNAYYRVGIESGNYVAGSADIQVG